MELILFRNKVSGVLQYDLSKHENEKDFERVLFTRVKVESDNGTPEENYFKNEPSFFLLSEWLIEGK